ncbi:MAG: glycosyltransferase family 4 protein [Muribaculaceae bacterium]|nr:glycosyltransferase family 4 protein [Muribaculaceae bacterium]
MRILLVTTHFFPESFKANDMAFELGRRGHDVTVLTPIPDYPHGKFYDGYGLFKRRREIVNGVKVIRTLVSPRRSGSAKWLGLNYLTYTIFSCIKALWLGLTKKYDVVLVHETSPVMVGIPAVIIKKLNKVQSHFWVLDLWPESLSAAGGINNRLILGCFNKLTRWIYNNSDSILISSKGFVSSITKMGDFQKKIKYFPNWIDNIENKEFNYEFNFPEGFNVVFTGNIGEAQDIEHILEAAKILINAKVNIILIGNGRKRDFAKEFVNKNRLSNVYLPGAFPREVMHYFYEHADVLFLSLKNSPIFALTVPAKLQAYMASGKAIVAMINGEGADLIKEADCGWSVPAENSDALAKLLLQLSKTEQTILFRKGENGKKYCQEHFDFRKCIDNLEEIINPTGIKAIRTSKSGQ